MTKMIKSYYLTENQRVGAYPSLAQKYSTKEKKNVSLPINGLTMAYWENVFVNSSKMIY